MLQTSNTYPTDLLQEQDAAHHWHPFTDSKALNSEGSRIITRADGIWMWDSDGNRILDGMAGLWCVNIGHGRPEIAEAVQNQMAELSYYNTFFKTSNPPVIALAKKLAEITPDHLNHVFFCNSGSEANDTVLRLVRTYWSTRGHPSKKVVISRHNAYHGSTYASASLGGMTAMHKQGGLPIPDIHHIAQPYWFGDGGDKSPAEFGLWAARELERAIDEIGQDNVAAFIGEPVQGAGGVVIPPETYWPEIERICRERDILLIADEVICGFGRLGTWFGFEHFGITPDIVPIAKGLSSGYLPIGGVMVSDEVTQSMFEHAGEFAHGYTYSGHPVACAAALANLEIMQNEDIIGHVRDVAAPKLRQEWLALEDHALVGQARTIGLLGALELVPDKTDRSKKFEDPGTVAGICRDIAMDNGLVSRAVYDSMVISPPLVITPEEISDMAARMRLSLDETVLELESQGLWPAA